MALLHATVFFTGKITATVTPTVVYTVPAGYRIILRSVQMANLWTSAQGCIVQHNGFRVFFKSLGALGSGTDTFEQRCWQVFGPGDTIGVLVGNATGVNVVVSGSIYTI